MPRQSDYLRSYFLVLSGIDTRWYYTWLYIYENILELPIATSVWSVTLSRAITCRFRTEFESMITIMSSMYEIMDVFYKFRHYNYILNVFLFTYSSISKSIQ